MASLIGLIPALALASALTLANAVKLYDFAEQEARAGRRGLWGDAVPVPPWEFRRGSR